MGIRGILHSTFITPTPLGVGAPIEASEFLIHSYMFDQPNPPPLIYSRRSDESSEVGTPTAKRVGA